MFGARFFAALYYAARHFLRQGAPISAAGLPGGRARARFQRTVLARHHALRARVTIVREGR